MGQQWTLPLCWITERIKGKRPTAVPLTIGILTFSASIIAISCIRKAERHGFEKSMNVLHLVRADIHHKLVLPAQAGIQRLKSLDYSINPCMLPFGPAFGCSLKLMDSILNITLSVMARRVSHRDVTNKSAPGRYSPARSMREWRCFLINFL